MTRWRWHWSSCEAQRELGEHPETMLETGTVIKSNPVRKVLAANGLICKFDSRQGHSFGREFRNAVFMERAGIPVAQHLAWGSSCSGSLLITREIPDAVTLSALAAAQIPGPEVCTQLVQLVNLMRERKIRHADWHGGNVLITPAGKPVLIDLCAVGRWWNALYRDENLQAIFMELRDRFPREAIHAMLRSVGVRDPEAFWKKRCELDLRRLMRQWPRRRAQILGGYPKFTRPCGNGWRDARAADAEIARSETLPCDVNTWLGQYFLRILHIPCRHILTWDGHATGTALPGDGTPLPDGDPIAADFRERLAALGIASSSGDWRIGTEGLPLLWHPELAGVFLQRSQSL